MENTNCGTCEHYRGGFDCQLFVLQEELKHFGFTFCKANCPQYSKNLIKVNNKEE